jgi:hypothetical protein
MPTAVFVLTLAAALIGCAHGSAPVDPARRQILENELRARHADLLARDPQAVSDLLARLARSSFAVYRARIALPPEEPSAFVTPATSGIALVGDPHPENVGTYQTARGERVVDFNDFDEAGHGPYVRDLRRLALGLWLTADLADLGRRQRTRAVEEMCEGYLVELQALGRGAPAVALRAESAFGGDLAAILADADDTPGGTGTAPLSDADRALVGDAMRAYPATLLGPAAFPAEVFAIKDVARASAGIASLQLLRFRVRVEGPGPSADDDRLLELKESPPDAAERLVRLQRELQEFADLDPLLGWAATQGRAFRVRSAGPEQRRLSVERISKRVRSPSWGKKDLRDLAYQCGRLLARGHARARTSQGVPGLAALRAAVGDGRGLTRETVDVTARAADAVEADRDHLRALLRERGPLLGWTAPGTGRSQARPRE